LRVNFKTANEINKKIRIMRNFHKIILTLFTFVFALSISIANGQEAAKASDNATGFNKHYFFNWNLGFTDFYGDMHPDKAFLSNNMFGGGINFGYQFSPVFAGRFNITSGRLLSASDYSVTEITTNYQYDTDLLRYKGQFTDFSAQLVVDFTNIFRKSADAKFGLYGFGGVGIMTHNANVFDFRDDEIYDHPFNGTDYGDYNNTLFIFPVGFGAKYALNNNFDLTLETSMRFTGYDLMDQTLGGNETFKNDRYQYTSLGITYKLVDGFGAKFDTIRTTKVFNPYFYANADFGFTNFFGDLHPDKVFGSSEMFGWGLKFGYQLDPIFGVRLNVLNGQLLSQSDYKITTFTASGMQYDTDLLRYKGVFTDVSGQLTVDFTNIFRDNYNSRFSLYGFGGVGVSFHNGNVYDMRDEDIYNHPHNASDYGNYRNNVIVFPAGLGAKYGLTQNMDVTIETSTRFSGYDLFDQTDGGNMMIVNDRYQYTSLGFTYKFINAASDVLGGDGVNKMVRSAGAVVYKVTPEVLQEKGGKVPYTISVTFPENYFGRGAVANVAPILKYGEKELPLASKTFVGEKVVGVDGQMVPYTTGGTYTYSGVFDFVPEMTNSTVVVSPVVYAPEAGVEPVFKNLAEAQIKIGDGVIHTEDFAGGNEQSLLADSGYESETVITKTANLYFPKNEFTYNKREGINNTESATFARETANKFLAQGWEIKNIAVNAYASPEGEETLNANLSNNRAKVADKYIHSELQALIKAKDSKINMKDCGGIEFAVVGNGPDWNGFMAALEASNMAEKNTILNVIKSASPSRKEAEIKNMILIYPELEKILSPLRRAEITVNCYEPKRSAEEIAQLATTNPQVLTLQELLYAATLTEDKQSRENLYKTAATMFGNSWEAQTNYAYSEIQNGNYSSALTYLEKANALSPNNASVLNNMGVVYAKQGQWDKAKKYFTNAQSLGANNNYNLGVASIQFGEYEKALSLFGTRKCDVNVGLAQLMLGKYEDAKANLSCAEETCKVNYLLAVVGSRTFKDAEVFTGLKKAIEMNPKLKGKALNDREFIRYFNNEEFLLIVK
jgi:tetratricopeptide (TPR) repeat protein